MIDPLDWVIAPGSFLRAAAEHRATLAWNPNFAYAFMADSASRARARGVDLSSFRGLANCSEPVTFDEPAAVLRAFRRHGLREDVFWGATRWPRRPSRSRTGTPTDAATSIRSGHRRVAPGDRLHVSVGRPLPGSSSGVVATDGDDLPDRELGEL